MRNVQLLNKYSLLLHAGASLLLVFLIEWVSRRSFLSAWDFVSLHTGAFLYNAFIVFATLSLAYLVKRRAFARVLILGFWAILGIINGCVLSQRVTPFGFTDLKVVSDLLHMTNAGYLNNFQIVLIAIGLVLLTILLVVFFRRGPVYHGKRHLLVMSLLLLLLYCVGLPATTEAAQREGIVDTYYANIAQGYSDNGFVYSFSSSVVSTGMSEPVDYSEDRIDQLVADTRKEAPASSISRENAPNIICVLLESFVDPSEIGYLQTNSDPIPVFHELEQNYTTGYLTVPVVGAGTANSEFEILSGMSLNYFGTGEYPYKTILKQTDCESVASVLRSLGYATHAVHNNGGNFYSRVNAFSQFGFDTFTSKEMMNITEWTPLGRWAEDSILVDETLKTLDATPGQPDFTYTITVGTHGAYPEEAVLENPPYLARGGSEAQNNQWTYYVNQLNKTDAFIRDLIAGLEERGEDTILVLWGDHLPTMGLTDADMKSSDIYKTKYVTWNNMGLEKADADLYAYQLMSYMTDQAGIHEGTLMAYHQNALRSGKADLPAYLAGMEDLQYDILYGDRFCYDGINPYPASNIVMGIADVEISCIQEYLAEDGETMLRITGDNFTSWSRVYVNDTSVEAEVLSDTTIIFRKADVNPDDVITVRQIGSSNSMFRSSNEWTRSYLFRQLDLSSLRS